VRTFLPLHLAAVCLITLPARGQTPDLSFPTFAGRPASALGMHGASSDVYAAVQKGSVVYRFNPASPLDRSLRRFSLPQGFKGQAVLRDDRLYLRKGNQVVRTRPGGLEPQDWFTSTRSFQAFQIMDDERVALVWTSAEPLGESPMYHAKPASALRRGEVSLLEVWDPESQTCRHREPLPEALLSVLDPFLPLVLGQVQTYRTDNGLLLLFPLLGQLYHFDMTRYVLRKVETPWIGVEADWVNRQLAALKTPRHCFLNSYFFATDLLAFPREGGGFAFTYGTLPLRTDTVTLLNSPAAQGRFQLLPHSPTTDTASDPSMSFHVALWDSVKRTLKPQKLEGPTDLKDPQDPSRRRWGGRLQMEGLYVNAQFEPQPSLDFLSQLDKVLAEREAKSPAAATPKQGSGPSTPPKA